MIIPNTLKFLRLRNVVYERYRDELGKSRFHHSFRSWILKITKTFFKDDFDNDLENCEAYQSLLNVKVNEDEKSYLERMRYSLKGCLARRVVQKKTMGWKASDFSKLTCLSYFQQLDRRWAKGFDTDETEFWEVASTLYVSLDDVHSKEDILDSRPMGNYLCLRGTVFKMYSRKFGCWYKLCFCGNAKGWQIIFENTIPKDPKKSLKEVYVDNGFKADSGTISGLLRRHPSGIFILQDLIQEKINKIMQTENELINGTGRKEAMLDEDEEEVEGENEDEDVEEEEDELELNVGFEKSTGEISESEGTLWNEKLSWITGMIITLILPKSKKKKKIVLRYTNEWEEDGVGMDTESLALALQKVGITRRRNNFATLIEQVNQVYKRAKESYSGGFVGNYEPGHIFKYKLRNDCSLDFGYCNRNNRKFVTYKGFRILRGAVIDIGDGIQLQLLKNVGARYTLHGIAKKDGELLDKSIKSFGKIKKLNWRGSVSYKLVAALFKIEGRKKSYTPLVIPEKWKNYIQHSGETRKKKEKAQKKKKKVTPPKKKPNTTKKKKNKKTMRSGPVIRPPPPVIRPPPPIQSTSPIVADVPRSVDMTSGRKSSQVTKSRVLMKIVGPNLEIEKRKNRERNSSKRTNLNRQNSRKEIDDSVMGSRSRKPTTQRVVLKDSSTDIRNRKRSKKEEKRKIQRKKNRENWRRGGEN